jgi:hypothetical protein
VRRDVLHGRGRARRGAGQRDQQAPSRGQVLALQREQLVARRRHAAEHVTHAQRPHAQPPRAGHQHLQAGGTLLSRDGGLQLFRRIRKKA